MPNFLTGVPAGAPAIGTADRIVDNTGRRGQQFRTYQVPNFQLALYSLQIRQPTGSNGLVDSYVFPLSPESLRKEFTDLTSFYDVQGGQANLGVQRIFDVYGQTPVVYTIEGTTGWTLHSTDGYKYTGLQSIARIEGLLSTYAQLNQAQIDNSDPNLYQLWFLDFFRNDYWQVFPVGQQGLRQSVSRPLYVSYMFRLAALRKLDGIEAQLPDALAAQLSQSTTQGAAAFQTAVQALFPAYSPATQPAT